MWPEDLVRLANAVINEAKARRMMISTVESCTGGLLGACITSQPGSSAVYDGGYVVYSHQAKDKLLQVPTGIFEQHGSVSQQAVASLAKEALNRSPSDVVVAITGIAGPGGGSAQKPVGTHFIHALRRDRVFKGEGSKPPVDDQRLRDEIRLIFVERALALLLDVIKLPPTDASKDELIASAAVAHLNNGCT